MLCRAKVHPGSNIRSHLEVQEAAMTNVPLTEIVCAHAIVHPWTVVVHAANASITDTAVVRHGWFECLTLPTHTVRILHQALSFGRNCGQRNTTRIGQTRLGVACQCHKYQYIVYHTENNRYAFRDCQEGDSHCRIQHQHPN